VIDFAGARGIKTGGNGCSEDQGYFQRRRSGRN
jgi:hypothetical protein